MNPDLGPDLIGTVQAFHAIAIALPFIMAAACIGVAAIVFAIFRI